MSDIDSTQSATGGEYVTFADVRELLTAQFDCADSSERHARLNVGLPEGTQPAMVYLGTSSLEASREVVNIASPLLGVSDDKSYDIATSMDAMPLGALRRLGGILHIHEALAFGEFSGDTLTSCIRLIAAQASSLRSSYNDGDPTSSENTQGGGK